MINIVIYNYHLAWSGVLSGETTRVGLGGEATIQGLRRATNYSISVRARSDAGPGPPSIPAYCSTLEDGNNILL